MIEFNPTPEQESIISPEIWESSIITASAGSGKTSTIIRRAINQIEFINNSRSWKHVAIISYTNRSKEDIRKQVKNLNGQNIISSTFHAFIIKHIFSFTSLFRNKEISFNFNHAVATKNDWCNYIKDSGKIPKTQIQHGDYFFEYALYLIRNNKNIQRYLKVKFIAIYIDEAQDNNEFQYNIVDEIIDLGIQVVMVGDPNQTIYQFRGSESDRFKNLGNNFRFRKSFYLTRNFRCNELINKCANSYKTPKYDIVDSKNKGHGVFVRDNKSFYKVMNYFKKQPREGLAFLMRGFKGFRNEYNRKIVECYNLPIIAQPEIVSSSSTPYYLDMLFRLYFGGSKEEIEYIENLMPETKRSVARNVIKSLKDTPSIYNIQELNKLVGLYSEEDFEEIINTFNSLEADRFYNISPTLSFAMTIHSAKGLEFNNVVMISNDFNSLNTEQDRNLFYVGCTRAKNRLFFMAD